MLQLCSALRVAAASTLMDLPGSADGAFAAKPTETREQLSFRPAARVPMFPPPCCAERSAELSRGAGSALLLE